jgi:DNA polymerase-3 subunit epsilon
MKAIFYDTETTGLPLFKEPNSDPRQPHIVQLAAILVDLETGETLHTFDKIVRPEGWVIPEAVAKIHRITQEIALSSGFPEGEVLSEFLSLWRLADFRVGHNEGFDARIIGIATLRYTDLPTQEAWSSGRAECTLLLATPILQIPPTPAMRAAGHFGFKSARLGEAYLYFTGKPLDGAHNALVDVLACIAVWHAVRTPSPP